MYIDCKILYQRSLFISFRTVEDFDEFDTKYICFNQQMSLEQYYHTNQLFFES